MAENLKTRVLEILENARGSFVSGKSAADELGVSRNAVWKAIEVLRTEGHIIEAVTNKGYRLAKESDVISLSGMVPFLNVDLKADDICIFDVAESTNKIAGEMAELPETKDGTVVIARSQRAGRGRRGRSFYSPEGGIYISFIFKPERMPLKDAEMFTIAAAVATCRAIRKVTGKNPGIKWINDLYMNGKKICGVLTESRFDMESMELKWIVTGIGINFKLDEKRLPKDIKGKAGGIYGAEERAFNEKNGDTVTKNMLIAELINQMWDTYKSEDRGNLINEYRDSLMMLGQKVIVSTPSETYEATAADIDESGRLIVEKADGTKEVLGAGEISITGN